MEYQFSFYRESDFEELEKLILMSYEWEYPVVSLSRLELSKGLHPAFLGYRKAWDHTVGMYRLNGKLVACVWNEGTYEGDLFFLFDCMERAEDLGLLEDMVHFCKMYGVTFDGETKRSFQIFVPTWNHSLEKLVQKSGFEKSRWADHCLIKPFSGKKLDVKLPKGYSIIDGDITPAFYLANVHRMAFGYGRESYACEHGEEAFEDLRKMKHYDKDLDLCIVDAMGRPVAAAVTWYDRKMPYCELEPLSVTWWERRRGLATALVNEAINRVMCKYSECKGMRGGDQQFYRSIGFEEKSETFSYGWEKDVYISWDERSVNQDYSKEML